METKPSSRPNGRILQRPASAGETLLLIDAGGGVGNAAAQIARRPGARVIGANNRMPRPDATIQAIAEKLIIGAKDLPAEVAAATGGKDADVVLDLVGGVMFSSAFKKSRPAGQADRNRRDRPARSEFRPCRFLSQ